MRVRAVAMVVAVGLVVAACSSGDGEEATTAGGAGTSSTADAGASSTAAGDDDEADPVTDGGDGGADLATLAAEVPAAPSAGCGSPEAGAEAGSESRVDTTVGGRERWYLRHVPSAHDGSTPVPVVMDLHGYSEGAEVHRAMTSMQEMGEAEGFVTIFPHGDGPVPRWESTPGSPDSDFLAQVLDEVEAELCVDTNRIYVTGLSNGAFMTSALMCDHADRIAAAAPIAGIQPVDGCEPARPVPVLTFHGTEDPFVSFDGGFGPGVATLPTPDGQGTMGDAVVPDEPTGPTVPEITAIWAERNGCEPEPTETSSADDVTEVAWDCPLGHEVVLVRIEGGGHTWPGSPFLASATDLVGTTTMSIDANEEMWAFFQEHPLGVTG